ncbi:RHS repeat-associated core domain-containing protein [bacterium]|nr:RHS repeat-associated core domain-containing protein [bacterium]
MLLSPLGRLIEISYFDPDGSEKLYLAYNYYDNNQIKDEQAFASGEPDKKKVYHYDSKNRLVNVEHSENNVATTNSSYFYDPAGNKTGFLENDVNKNIFYDSENRIERLEFTDGSKPTIVYIYDKNGSLVSKSNGNNEYSFEYSARNKLVKITHNKDGSLKTYSYSYYPESDLRKSVNVDGDLNYFVYEGQNEKFILNESKEQDYSYTNSPFGYDNKLYKSKLSNTSTGDDEIFFRDLLNSVRGTFALSAPTPLKIQDYSSFGTTLSTGAYDLQASFTGRIDDTHSGLKYFRGRYLDTDSGTFTQVDPMQDGTNWYAYVGGDPINNNDPSGYTPAEIANLGFVALDFAMLVKNSVQLQYYNRMGNQQKVKEHSALVASWSLGLGLDIASLANPLDPGARGAIAHVSAMVLAKSGSKLNKLHGAGNVSSLLSELGIQIGALFNSSGNGAGGGIKTGGNSDLQVKKSNLNPKEPEVNFCEINLKPSTFDVIASALNPSKAGSKTSRGIQALTKKIQGKGKGKNFQNLKANQNTVNDLIKEIIQNNKNPIFKSGLDRNKVEILDIFNPTTKRGIRFRKDNGDFYSFVNLD